MTLIQGSKGGKGGGGGSRTPVEADDSLSSVSYATVVDLLSEGPIEGMDTGAIPGDGEKSIFLDDTPIKDSSGNANFEGYTLVGRNGTQDQTYISELIGNESEKATGLPVDITNADGTESGAQAGSTTKQIQSNSNADRIRVTIQIPVLRTVEDDGDIVGRSVRIRIDVQYNNGGFNSVVTDTISGKTSNAYLRDYVFPLTGAFPVDIKVLRLSKNDVGSKQNSVTKWTSWTEIIDEKLRYPNSALAYLRFDSRQFSNIPTRRFKIRGIKVKIPSNATVDTTTHPGRLTYSGIWDGQWKAGVHWTNCPAMCLYDLLTNDRYGCGIAESALDRWDFFSISKYCNELVSDGKGSTEPRFSLNIVINSRDEIYNVIKEITSIFRGMCYYGAGSIVMFQDKPADSQYLIGPSNVVDGLFEYSGTSQRSRHSTCTVAWQSYDALGEVQLEYVEDADAVSKFGIQNKDVKALGCYSQGQAHRLGLWLLKSEKFLTETVSFSVGIESGIVLRPGVIIDIADPVKSGTRRQGRISAGSTTTAIKIDSDTNLSVNLGNSPTISVMMPTGLVETKIISGISGTTVNVTSAFSEAPNDEAVWLIQTSDVQSQQFRVLSVKESAEGVYGVTALKYNSSIYGSVDSGEEVVLRSISNLSAAPAPVTSIDADPSTGFLYSDGQGVFVGCSVSWNHNRARLSEFRVQYKMDNDNWQSISTASPSITLRNLRAGTLHVRVQALNYLGKSSPVVSQTFAIAGKTAAPEDVQGLMMIPSTSSLARLFWDQCADLDVIVGGWVRLRHSPDTSNVTWATATSIHADLPGSAKEAYCDLKGGTYLAKFVDSGGRTSVNATLVEFTKPDLDDIENVNTQTEHGTFPGTKTNLTVDSPTNELRMALDGGTESGNATFHTTGTYLFQNNPIDLGDVFSVRLNSTLKARSFFPYNPFVDTFADWDNLASVDGNTPDTCDVKLYLRTTQLANPGASDWTSWRLFHNAEFSARKYELKAECSTGGGLEQKAIQQLKVETVAISRTTSGSGTTTTSGDVSITFPNKFLSTPAIGITFSTSQSGDFYEIPSITSTGFTISIYNASSQRQARTFRWTATGYGKR